MRKFRHTMSAPTPALMAVAVGYGQEVHALAL
jgi:hypothetical protein